ncbi:hypothetical protein PTKIN_Ptkin02bG0234600 [Pterospermum kingtungense]
MGTLSDVNFLVKGYRGGNYICPLANPNFSPKQNIVLPEPLSEIGYLYAHGCKGLLFLDDYRGHCLIWNPSSGEHKVLPPSSLEKLSPPAVDNRFFLCSGFGFDSKSEDYKAVKFLRNYFKDEFGFNQEVVQIDEKDRIQHQVEVYSLNRDSWKPISFPQQARSFFEPATYIDGVHYWMAYDRSGKGLIISFDYADEKFSSFPLPHYFVFGKHSVHLMEFEGSLAAALYPFRGTVTFDIWVRKGNSWTQKFTTEPVPGAQRLLGFLNKGEQMFIEGSNNQLLLYECATKEMKDIGIRNDNPGTMHITHYVETSVQLNSGSLAKKRKLHDLPDIKNKKV